MTCQQHSMKKPFNFIALAALAVGLCGCASTSIKQSWKSPAFQGGPLQKVSVLAVEDRGDIRQALENRLVIAMRGHGQDAIATHSLLALSAIKADREAAAARLREAGAEAVLVVRLVDLTTYTHELQATPAMYVPIATGYDTFGWYDYCTVAFVNMGVVWGSTTQEVYLDSSLFDLKTGKRIWSALTRTVLKENADRLVEADLLVDKVVRAMRKDGVVR